MTAIVFYFQVHQPNRLNRIRFEDVGTGREYFDDALNKLIAERVSERCYRPMTELLGEAIADTGGRFRCAFALSGTLITQLERWAPKALDGFVALARTGAVEFVCETGYHSLAAVGEPRDDLAEFVAQVEEQRKRLKELFGLAPTSFRNTELILDNRIARQVEQLGFDVLLGEGVDRLLAGRSPRRVYRAKGCTRLKLLLRDYLFSDDIAFRFSNRQWPEYPLMAERYAEGSSSSCGTCHASCWRTSASPSARRPRSARPSPRWPSSTSPRRSRGPTRSATSRPGSRTTCRRPPTRASTRCSPPRAPRPRLARPSCSRSGASSRPPTTSIT
jgi:alpha-amylase